MSRLQREGGAHFFPHCNPLEELQNTITGCTHAHTRKHTHTHRHTQRKIKTAAGCSEGKRIFGFLLVFFRNNNHNGPAGMSVGRLLVLLIEPLLQSTVCYTVLRCYGDQQPLAGITLGMKGWIGHQRGGLKKKKEKPRNVCFEKVLFFFRRLTEPLCVVVVTYIAHKAVGAKKKKKRKTCPKFTITQIALASKTHGQMVKYRLASNKKKNCCLFPREICDSQLSSRLGGSLTREKPERLCRSPSWEWEWAVQHVCTHLVWPPGWDAGIYF